MTFWHIFQLLRLAPEAVTDLGVVLPIVKKWIIKLEVLGIIQQQQTVATELKMAAEQVKGSELSADEQRQLDRASQSWGAG